MPVNFPSNPSLNQTYSLGSKTWIWNGYAWDLRTANTLTVSLIDSGNVVSNVTLNVSNLNFDTSGFTLTNFGSGNVKISSIGGGGGGASVSVSDSPPTSPTANSLWWQSNTGALKIYYNDGDSSQWVDASPLAYTLDNVARTTAAAAFAKANTRAAVDSWIDVSDGLTSTFTLPFEAIANAGVIVSIGGIVQSENYDYVLTPSNSTISFSDPPPAGERIRVAGYTNVLPSYIDAANSAGAQVYTFEGTGDGSTQQFNLGFIPVSGKAIFVSLGGVLQPESAYIVNPSPNTSIYFIEAPANDETIRVVGFSRVNPFYPEVITSNVTVSVSESVANGAQTVFQLGFNPQARETILVTIDGIVQPISSYTVNTSTYTLTLDEAPASGEVVRATSFYTAANAYIIPDGSVTVAKFGPDANVFFQAAFDAANTANAAASTGKAIAMSIVFGG